MDLNVVIPAFLTALTAIGVAWLNKRSPKEIVKNEPRASDDEKDAVIRALTDAYLHCIEYHGGPHATDPPHSPLA